MCCFFRYEFSDPVSNSDSRFHGGMEVSVCHSRETHEQFKTSQHEFQYGKTKGGVVLASPGVNGLTAYYIFPGTFVLAKSNENLHRYHKEVCYTV